jgi:hypothetical protein
VIGRVSTVSVLTDNGDFIFDLKMVMLMTLKLWTTIRTLL